MDETKPTDGYIKLSAGDAPVEPNSKPTGFHPGPLPSDPVPGYIRIYTGARPAMPGSEPTGQLMYEIPYDHEKHAGIISGIEPIEHRTANDQRSGVIDRRSYKGWVGMARRSS